MGPTLGIILREPSSWFYEPGTGLGSLSIGPCLLASRPKQSPCFRLPSACNHHAHLFHVHVPSQSVKMTLNRNWAKVWSNIGIPSLNWRKTDFILLNQGRRGRKGGEGEGVKKGGGEEEREKECLDVSATEPTKKICKIGRESLFSLGDF